ncbi:ATP-binding protein [Yinghuangia sp. ASG 101]|uniref:ATP-binding protein n=1 Tax=Yinghuangia sp. ASG 101 TaxID=2896848 RepID=UPI001E4D1BC8|nr:ATP-binding protein [Yinghuangia sp. ASG 101]UGQ09239.1 ATP-binding protein [Yinghuangia sp. ASG 101]
MNNTTPEPMAPARLAWSWRLPADASSVKIARDRVSAHAARCGVDRETVRLVVSELASNAVRHAHGSEDFVVAVRWQPDMFGIALIDSAPHLLPALNIVEIDMEHTAGRGLAIVARLADEIEVTVNELRKAVCVVFRTPRPDSRIMPGTSEPMAPVDAAASEDIASLVRAVVAPTDVTEPVRRSPVAVPLTLNSPSAHGRSPADPPDPTSLFLRGGPFRRPGRR